MRTHFDRQQRPLVVVPLTLSPQPLHLSCSVLAIKSPRIYCSATEIGAVVSRSSRPLAVPALTRAPSPHTSRMYPQIPHARPPAAHI
ncbi:hypothetical protein FIBSPDRAFT_848465 [Athelia psychrophila]|uniref:Uncharacterized protein n=1 Tax=Athelia psychrophila TaxID=1759441 RepID=A0A166VFD9_9AGAM|nr:hypothetical protein FIBSPDRAFT_848465 [Fibularhizoctonia sp. CBS 109695]